MTGYIIWSLLIIGALALTVAVGWGLFASLAESWSETMAWVATGLYSVGALGVWFGLLIWAVNESEKPPKGHVEWIGGSGPATECEYVIKDDDSIVIVGKVPVHTEDSDVYTRCSVEGPR